MSHTIIHAHKYPLRETSHVVALSPRSSSRSALATAAICVVHAKDKDLQQLLASLFLPHAATRSRRLDIPHADRRTDANHLFFYHSLLVRSETLTIPTGTNFFSTVCMGQMGRHEFWRLFFIFGVEICYFYPLDSKRQERIVVRSNFSEFIRGGRIIRMFSTYFYFSINTFEVDSKDIEIAKVFWRFRFFPDGN